MFSLCRLIFSIIPLFLRFCSAASNTGSEKSTAMTEKPRKAKRMAWAHLPHPTSNTIEFAGAFFPLYIIRENRLLDFKGDKYPLGMTPGSINYTNYEIDLLENDMMYLFSDGYVDQFGGEENKKFMYRRFRYLLMTINRFPVEDQKSILEENIKTWMGNAAQVDDILVMGFKPL